ncbi:hypothetical protein Tco_0094206, partial [Tanacetum coccineum]
AEDDDDKIEDLAKEVYGSMERRLKE